VWSVCAFTSRYRPISLATKLSDRMTFFRTIPQPTATDNAVN
jgi:hypothetical protein